MIVGNNSGTPDRLRRLAELQRPRMMIARSTRKITMQRSMGKNAPETRASRDDAVLSVRNLTVELVSDGSQRRVVDDVSFEVFLPRSRQHVGRIVARAW